MTSFTIITTGCTHNFSDSEQMAGLLKEAQFNHVKEVEDADIVIFNTCTVKGPSESAFFRNLEKIKVEHPYKTIIIAGCIPQSDPLNPVIQAYSLLGTRQFHKIVEVVEEALNDNVVHLLEHGEVPPLNLPRIRKNPVIGVIPINVGCLGACTFCKTKSARFNLKSYSIDEILQEAKTALEDGVKEIWLTSQDTFCYGFDIQTNLPELLQKIIALPYEFKLRIGMGNPDHWPKIGNELLEVMENPKIFKFLHIPLQAGHNHTLEQMKRRYTVQQFRDIIDQVREKFAEINIMTDIIVGYPTETEDHFWGTLQALRRVQPDSCNISRFWPRPETEAAKLQPLQGEVVKQRSRVITDIFHNISTLQNERWKEWRGEIIIDEKGHVVEGKQQWIGRNYCYKPVILDGEYELGQIVEVKIGKTGKFDLRGKEVLNPLAQ